MKRRLPALLVATTLILCACAPMGGRGPENVPPGGERDERGGGGTSVVANIQERLRLTAEALKLTPTQLPLWDRYQEKIGALMADQMKMESHQARQGALQQISRRVDTARNRLTAMEDIHESAGKLYAALDDKQKLIADQMLISTVPALYSGLGSGGGGSERDSERPGRRGGPGGGGGMGGPGGGMGGGFGRM
ncbi:MAG: Spy/CpxP family protein refolding chaperone [Azonexus sp.]